MKKLTLLLPFIVLSACTMDEDTNQVANAANQAPTHYNCEQDSTIDVTYAANGDIANLQVTIPPANVDRAALEMQRAVSGSGERYVNDANPDEVYEWQSKANDGVFTITQSSGNQYTLVCQAS